MQPETVVSKLLENDEFKKRDNAYQSGKKLYALKQKSLGIFQEMIRSLGYERALAKHGIKKEDVAHCLVGAQIGATHNYKGKRPAKFCTNEYCDNGRLKRPLKNVGRGAGNDEICPSCQQKVTTGETPISPSHLRDKMAEFIVGVETKEGKYIFFDEPLRPDPWNEVQEEGEPLGRPKDPLPIQGKDDRLGKWW